MDPNLAHELIDVIGVLGAKSIVLIGGEPTLYPHLAEVAGYAIESSVTPVMVTNGVRFSSEDFCLKVIDAGINKLTISVKGTSQEQYTRLTKTNGFIKMLKGVQNLRRFGIEPSFEITVVREYLTNLEEILAALTNLGVRQLTIDLASPVLFGDQVDIPGVPDPFELRDAVHQIYRSTDSSEVDYVIYMTIPFCLLDPDVLLGLKKEDRLISSCHVPHGNALIFDEQGKILPCNHMEGQPLGQWGVDFTSARELMEYWNTSELQEFRSTCSCYPAEPCKTCPYWGECGGGCLIKWLYWDPAEYVQGFQNGKEVSST
jgi:radical SAM protein with 4Fe4S-binding SPASM domain